MINVNRSVTMVEGLIYDFSEIVNISTGRVLLTRGLVTVEEIVLPVMEMAKPQGDLKKQSLTLEIMPNLPKPSVDCRRLDQVLTNIISNAIKHTRQGDEIRTPVVGERDTVRFCVSDNGPGIPSEHLPNLFDPFFRVPGHAASANKGPGLGIAMAKSLVELHDGNIRVESRVGEGSEFCFTIPMNQS